MSKVSVVMNFYNEEEYLPQAIESILKQTYRDFELLLIDDASTDRSNQIANSYKDSRIRVIRNQNNQGLAYSRNVGIREAQGEYIAFADADDYSAINRIEIETQYLDKHKDILAVSCWMNYIDEEGKLIKHESFDLANQHTVRASFLIGNPFPNPGSMIRRTVFDEYGILQKEELRVSQDYYFWLQVLEVGELQIIPEKLLFYRVHNSKASQNAKKNKRQYDTMMKNLVGYAWKSFGFNMIENDIDFIYTYLFNQNYIKKVSDLVKAYTIWRKICKQMNAFSEEDRHAIKRVYTKRVRKIVLYLHPIRYVSTKIVNIVKKIN